MKGDVCVLDMLMRQDTQARCVCVATGRRKNMCVHATWVDMSAGPGFIMTLATGFLDHDT